MPYSSFVPSLLEKPNYRAGPPATGTPASVVRIASTKSSLAQYEECVHSPDDARCRVEISRGGRGGEPTVNTFAAMNARGSRGSQRFVQLLIESGTATAVPCLYAGMALPSGSRTWKNGAWLPNVRKPSIHSLRPSVEVAAWKAMTPPRLWATPCRGRS